LYFIKLRGDICVDEYNLVFKIVVLGCSFVKEMLVFILKNFQQKNLSYGMITI